MVYFADCIVSGLPWLTMPLISNSIFPIAVCICLNKRNLSPLHHTLVLHKCWNTSYVCYRPQECFFSSETVALIIYSLSVGY